MFSTASIRGVMGLKVVTAADATNPSTPSANEIIEWAGAVCEEYCNQLDLGADPSPARTLALETIPRFYRYGVCVWLNWAEEASEIYLQDHAEDYETTPIYGTDNRFVVRSTGQVIFSNSNTYDTNLYLTNNRSDTLMTNTTYSPSMASNVVLNQYTTAVPQVYLSGDQTTYIPLVQPSQCNESDTYS